MSVTSGFFNSLSGDRKYDAIQISSMFDGLITDGIYNGYLESFMVTASSPASMVVTVGEGRCWFNHTWTLNDAPLPLTLDVGDVVLNRIDTIVIDVDSTDTVRACTIKVIKGTPSSQAVRPTLENTETHHQYPLCDISVPAGATTVTQSNITNRRGTSDCPFVATLMESVDVDDLLIQWESQWNDWMTDRANAMDSWTAEQQEAFTTWFQTVQDILDEDTAGNLLNLIQQEIVDRKAVDSELKSGKFNATAERSGTTVSITAPDGVETLVFVAPANWTAGDTYTINGQVVTLTDLNGEAVEDAWKKGSPVQLFIQGNKAFFKAGGAGVNETLPAQVTNFKAVQASGAKSVTVSWTKPSSYFSGILIVRKTGSAPTGVKDGTKVYDGTGTSFVDSSVDYNTTYYYRAFPYNSKGQYQTEYLVANVTLQRYLRLDSRTEGTLIRINESGSPILFILVKKNYESTLNGSGRQLMLRKDKFDEAMQWNTVRVNTWGNCSIRNYLNVEYNNKFSSSVRNMMRSTKYYYSPGGKDITTVSTISDSVFLPSFTEMAGHQQATAHVEGSLLPNASSIFSGTERIWTRTPQSTSQNDNQWVFYASYSASGAQAPDYTSKVRPMFTLPGDAMLNPTPNDDGSYTLIES